MPGQDVAGYEPGGRSGLWHRLAGGLGGSRTCATRSRRRVAAAAGREQAHTTTQDVRYEAAGMHAEWGELKRALRDDRRPALEGATLEGPSEDQGVHKAVGLDFVGLDAG